MSIAGGRAPFDELAAHQVKDDPNCQWRIARRPEANVGPAGCEWHEEPVLDRAEQGEVLLRTLYLGLAPVMEGKQAGRCMAPPPQRREPFR
jgi:NADPH-dependent curcumin reductase CurA